METIKYIGFLAALLSTSTFIPQLYTTWKHKSASGLSFPMLCIYNTAGVCWLTYGILIDSLPVIICNSISTLTGFILLFLKYMYENRLT